jgi:hypothetical protein
MNKSLYNIEQEYIQLMHTIETNEGELTEELEKQLVIHEKDRNKKSIAYLEVIGSKESFNSRIDDEIKRLHTLKRQNGVLISKLKESLLNAVKLFGVFEVGLHKFGTRKSSSVEVDISVNELPAKYKTVKVTEQPDKVAIKAALICGDKIPGCKIIEKKNLKIN